MAFAGGVVRRLVQGVGSKGVVEPTWWRPKLCWRPGIVAWVSALAACSGPRRLALPVRRRTASEDGACSNDIVGRLGLQRTAAGCSVLVGDSGEVHSRKTVQVTTCLAGLTAKTVYTGGATRCYRSAGAVRLFDGDLGNGATLFIILMAT
jgi:hypothetical protein